MDGWTLVTIGTCLGVTILLECFRRMARRLKKPSAPARPRQKLVVSIPCRGTKHVFIYFNDEWHRLLPAIAARAARDELCPHCAGRVLGVAAHMAGVPQTHLEPLARDLAAEVDYLRETEVRK